MNPEIIQVIITLASFLVLGTVYIVNGRNAAKILGTKLGSFDHTIEDFKNEMKKLQEVIVALAVQGTRIQTIDDRMLEQGKRVDRVAASVSKILVKMAIPSHDHD